MSSFWRNCHHLLLQFSVIKMAIFRFHIDEIRHWLQSHYSDVTISAMASQITSLTIVYSTVYSGADQRKHQSSAQVAYVRGIHRWPVDSPHKGPVTWKMFPFDDVIMHNFGCSQGGKWRFLCRKGDDGKHHRIDGISANVNTGRLFPCD